MWAYRRCRATQTYNYDAVQCQVCSDGMSPSSSARVVRHAHQTFVLRPFVGCVVRDRARSRTRRDDRRLVRRANSVAALSPDGAMRLSSGAGDPIRNDYSSSRGQCLQGATGALFTEYRLPLARYWKKREFQAKRRRVAMDGNDNIDLRREDRRAKSLICWKAHTRELRKSD